MSLEDQIATELAEQMCSEIDFNILSDMLVKACGWHKVHMQRFWNNNHAVNVLLWCEQNIKHPYEHRGAAFVFENEGDAVNFTLKWL